MKKGLIFMEGKYQDELLPWFTYLGVPIFVLYIAGYLIKEGMGGLLMSTAVIIPFTSIIVANLSLKYGGKYILSIASLGGISYGMIIMYLGLNYLKISGVNIKHYILLAIILMGVSSVICSREKFSERDELIRVGMTMMISFTVGAFLGVILGLLFVFIIGGGKALLIGLLSGIIISIVYFGARLGKQFNLDENEIYRPKSAGIIGAGIGGGIGLIVNRMYSFYYPTFYYEISAMKIPLTLVINLIAGLIAGLFFGYFSQKIKKRVDEDESD